MNRLVVVSNRVPDPSGSGNAAGGLAVALGGLMNKRGGVWFGWSGDVVDAPPAAPRMTVADNVTYATIDLSPVEHERYYGHFSNAVLWPLLHTMPELMAFDRRDAQAYRAVNARFADALVPMLRPNDLIWVHDYHLMALPALLRARGVRNPIGFFLHIPFPGSDVLTQVPEAASLVRDLLAADLVGVQTDRDVANVAEAAATIAGATAQPDGTVSLYGHRVRLGAFPVEISARDFAATAERSATSPGVAQLRESVGRQALILGVDRLDPTKGLLQRVAGFRRLIETRPAWNRAVTFLQIAAVSRKDVQTYRDLRTALDRDAGALNADLGEPDWTPLRLIARGGARDVMAGYMRAANVGLVTPLRDGMNLVAKEYVAAQAPDDPGVLVLSKFAGAARQLDAALMVNPHDADDMADALDRALRMERSERRARHAALWDVIADATPLTWGRQFLAALLRAVLSADTAITLRPRRTVDPMTIARTTPLSPDLPEPRQVN